MSRPCALGMVLKGYPRISETFISNEILLLESLGHEVRIFSMRAPREAVRHGSIAAIKAPVTYLPSTLLPNLHRFLLPSLACLLRSPGRFLKTFAGALTRFAGTRKIATLKHFFQGAYIVASGDFDGVTHLHAHFAHSPSSVAGFAAKLSGVPFSFTAHAKDIYTQKPERLAPKLAAASFVVTCTEYNRRHLLELLAQAGERGKDVHRVYHGIDLSLFSREDTPRTAASPPYELLTVARFVEKKGLDTLARAVKLLRDEGVDLHWTVIGEGELKGATEALVQNLGLSAHVDFLGTQPHEAVVERMQGADAFALGCRVAPNGDRDGIPNVLVEALAMGVPSLATTVSAIPELIEDGETGLTVPPDDPRAMADGLKRLLTDETLRARIIPQGIAKVRAAFDNKALIHELAGVYAAHGAVPASGVDEG